MISGDVITKLPQLGQTLPVKRVFLLVRCCELRSTGAFGADTEHVLWEKTKKVWEPPAGVEYQTLGDWVHPFRISIPPEAIDIAASSQCLREWKVVWRLEIAIDHQPIPFVGSRISKAYNLNLHNYRLPNLPPLSPPQAITLGSDSTSTQIFLTSPHGAFGPGDTFTVSFHAKPEDPSAIIKKASIILERRVEFLDEKVSPTHISREISPDSPASSASRLSSIFRRSASPRPGFHRILSDPSVLGAELDPSGRVVKDKVAEVACDQFTVGSAGTFWCSAAIKLPRRGGKWDIGETISTKLASITYELRLKIVIKATKPRPICKEYSCGGIPVTLTAVSASDRTEAKGVIAAAAAAIASSTSSAPKRRHRSSRRGLYMQEGTIDISEPAVASHHRRRTKTRSINSSPILSLITGIATDIKPILLSPDHPAQSQSISFDSPSPQASDSSPPKKRLILSTELSLLDTSIHPAEPVTTAMLIQSAATSAPLVSTTLSTSTFTIPALPSSSALLSPASATLLSTPTSYPVDYESMSILGKFQHSGRRISTTMSEEEEMQPSRSRQRLLEDDLDIQAEFDSFPVLPSLDALGLGLPQIPDRMRPACRPRGAPMYSSLAITTTSPPLSGALSKGQHHLRPLTLMARTASRSVPVE